MSLFTRIISLTGTVLLALSIMQGKLQQVIYFQDIFNEIGLLFILIIASIVQAIVVISEIKNNRELRSLTGGIIMSGLLLGLYPVITSAGTKAPEPEVNSIDSEQKWRDSVYCEYSLQAQLYLDRHIFKGTPLTGEIMAECALNAYDSTGYLVPVEFALAQAQIESSMGRKGRSPKNNPYNIGEWDTGTVTVFKSTRQGVQSYYNRITHDYLECSEIVDLLINFTNCNSHRYAASPTYEKTLQKQYRYIQRWLKKHK